MLIRARLPPSPSPTHSPHLGSADLKIKVLTQVMGVGEPWGLESQLFACSLPRATANAADRDGAVSSPEPEVALGWPVTPTGSKGGEKGQKTRPGVLPNPGRPVPTAFPAVLNESFLGSCHCQPVAIPPYVASGRLGPPGSSI